ncbi:hypothetical protein LSAT2_031798 [Lamellibrachia satsuma]|nr:hypothetical protein LSAT2_031798 [Lamellibrachia satsuma]
MLYHTTTTPLNGANQTSDNQNGDIQNSDNQKSSYHGQNRNKTSENDRRVSTLTTGHHAPQSRVSTLTADHHAPQSRVSTLTTDHHAPQSRVSILLKEKTRSLVSQKDARGDAYSRKRFKETNFEDVDAVQIIWFWQ